MRTTIFLLLIIIGISTPSYSQSSKTPSWRISDFQFSIGTEVANTSPIIRPNEFNRFAPGSIIIDPGQYGYNGYGWMPDWTSSLLTIQIGLHPMAKVTGQVKNRQTLRLGITAQGVSTELYSTHTDSRYRKDTLLTTGSGSTYGYVDSVSHRHVYADYTGTAIKLDAAYLWSTDPERRFSFYGGVGANAGVLLATSTRVSSNEWSNEEITDTRGYTISGYSYEAFDFGRNKEEQFRNKTGWSASMFIPLGVDLRLAKKKNPWNQLHLFTEIRPSLTIMNIPETKTYILPGVQNTFGFKVHW